MIIKKGKEKRTSESIEQCEKKKEWMKYMSTFRIRRFHCSHIKYPIKSEVISIQYLLLAFEFTFLSQALAHLHICKWFRQACDSYRKSKKLGERERLTEERYAHLILDPILFWGRAMCVSVSRVGNQFFTAGRSFLVFSETILNPRQQHKTRHKNDTICAILSDFVINIRHIINCIQLFVCKSKYRERKNHNNNIVYLIVCDFLETLVAHLPLFSHPFTSATPLQCVASHLISH